jgi:hypothetical protein
VAVSLRLCPGCGGEIAAGVACRECWADVPPPLQRAVIASLAARAWGVSAYRDWRHDMIRWFDLNSLAARRARRVRAH